jgi:putative component of toxin-antitoxin plasmid stabilization module
MFEPLMRLVDKHGTDYKHILQDVRKHLAEVVENTESKMQFDQFGDYSATGKGVIELQNTEGGYWEVFCTGITRTKEGQVAVYVGTKSADSLVAVINDKGMEASGQKYFVPPRSSIFVVGEADEEIHAHFQVKRLIEKAAVTTHRSISHDVTEIDTRISEPERHRVPRTEKPSPEELRR